MRKLLHLTLEESEIVGGIQIATYRLGNVLES